MKIFYSIIIIFFSSIECCELIEELHVSRNRLEIRINEEFKQEFLLDDFFVEYDADINLEKLDYSLVILPFVMNVISLIWISGRDYSVESFDEEAFASLERIKKIFKVFYPKTEWNGRLIPKTLERVASLSKLRNS